MDLYKGVLHSGGCGLCGIISGLRKYSLLGLAVLESLHEKCDLMEVTLVAPDVVANYS